jgi:outer membrane lipoprotein LolB
VHARRIAILVPALVLLMAGCAGQPELTDSDRNWQQRSAQLSQLTHWRAEGKVALRNAERAESANLSWLQQDNKTRLDLSGPIGLGATTITTDGNFLEVTREGNLQRFDVSTPEAMVRETGWNLPMHALQYWLKGIPAPDLEIDEQRIERGLLNYLSQSGWTISYQSYGQFGPLILPTKLQIETQDSRARVIVRKWTTDAA